MWKTIVLQTLSRLVKRGRLEVTLPDGSRHEFGEGTNGPDVALRLTDPARLRHLVQDPELALGEAYMDGTLVIERGDLRQMLTLFAINGGRDALPPLLAAGYAARFRARRFAQANGLNRARANVAHHYDLGDDFYELFLDADWQYSCAYFAREGMTLEEAQAAKKAHIARKLLIQPGMRVLDIGCGWGGMALTLARDFGAQVTGVTLSENQKARAEARAAAAGLSDRIDIRLQDYRTLDERFDRIVSVGMLEHVGAPNYGTYFNKVEDLLDPDGIALIHTIGRCGPPTTTSTWLAKYIFPGGYNPSLSELAGGIETTDLWQADIEVWRGHYAETLRRWQKRFEANLDRVREMYDDRFIRMWRYYLTGAEVSFDAYKHVVFQMQLTRRRDTVPNTRDYLYAQKAAAE
ncbi:cyclopropane-fatty-acyl-phospholipid synthase family protein [Jannaschia ovalis]|uniref:Cyclopropane-fatty-acyl-phospholipid synthase n=1 Tax=Jannaschia ovalis TaxID=3038773 RepID=A0ABY8L8Y6_9RHOB|nr:cyclopropane-fatty-acyl-phospholipid synthase family protein [Jannaschia sp. GRR-S6-38]WGH77816.1 cyclopropane-fatty-acyl-phospholipid synthase [Jannaschia sp. GRR-S6-38]